MNWKSAHSNEPILLILVSSRTYDDAIVVLVYQNAVLLQSVKRRRCSTVRH